MNLNRCWPTQWQSLRRSCVALAATLLCAHAMAQGAPAAVMPVPVTAMPAPAEAAAVEPEKPVVPVEIPAAVQALDGQWVLAQGHSYTVRLQDLREAAREFVSAGKQAQFWQTPQMMAEMTASLYRQQVLAAKARAAGLALPAVADSSVLTALQATRELGNLYLAREVERRMPTADAVVRYAKAEYERTAANYDHGEIFRVSHILVGNKARTDEQARERVQSVIDRLAKGEDFAALAEEMSNDNSSRKNGGSLDYREAKELPEDFVAELNKMDVGSRSTVPVKTQLGYHVIWLHEKRPPGRLSFDDVREHLVREIVEKLSARAQQAVWSEALDGFVSDEARLDQVATAMRGTP